jgi:hypothetical protein
MDLITFKQAQHLHQLGDRLVIAGDRLQAAIDALSETTRVSVHKGAAARTLEAAQRLILEASRELAAVQQALTPGARLVLPVSRGGIQSGRNGNGHRRPDPQDVADVAPAALPHDFQIGDD